MPASHPVESAGDRDHAQPDEHPDTADPHPFASDFPPASSHAIMTGGEASSLSASDPLDFGLAVEENHDEVSRAELREFPCFLRLTRVKIPEENGDDEADSAFGDDDA